MRRRVHGRGIGRATRLFAVGRSAVAVLLGAAIVHPALASAYNDTYLRVSVTAKNPISTTIISDQEIALQADLTQRINDGAPASGLSLKGLAALVGVDPATIQSVTVATADDQKSDVVSGTEVMSGFPDDPNASDSDPTYAWFTPGGDDDGVIFTWPGPAPWESDYIAAGVASAAPSYLDVDFDVSGEVLTVGTPHVSNPVPTAGQAVTFVPPTVSLNGTRETSGLTYTWNFGDGGSSTGPSPSYVYPTAGTWDAWVTVTDANGFQGVSPQVSIQVGKAVGAPGQSAGGASGGGGGSSPSGGGNGSPNSPSSGASSGASDVPVQSGTPVPKRQPKQASQKKSRPKQSRAAGAKTQTGGSGQGSGGSGGAGGSGTGAGSAAGSAGSGGAANTPAGGSKGVTGAGRHGSGGQAGPKDPSLSHAVPPGQIGVLIDSSGGTVAVGGPVTSWLSVVRAAARGSAATGTPVDWQWLIGVLAVVTWVAVGVLREIGTRFRRRPLAT